jgi:hypothetical protein
MQKDTIAIHAGYDKKSGNGEMAIPISQTTAYAFRDAEHAANLFALKELGPIYTRLNNPTNDILEQRYAQLENGAAALVTASGASAIFYAIANIAEAGDNILISDKLYGGSVTLFHFTLKRFGISVKTFKSDDASKLETVINTVNKLKGTNHRCLGWYHKLLVKQEPKVKGEKWYKKLMILCHFPIEDWDSKHHGSAMIHGHCLDMATEVLTKDGWKFRKDLSASDQVASYNSVLKQMQYESIDKFVDLNYTGEVYHFKSKNSTDMRCPSMLNFWKLIPICAIFMKG